MSHPRDPRTRRHLVHGPVDAAAAAVRLQMAADSMRTEQLRTGPEPEALAAAAQSMATEPPITAAEFAAAVAPENLEVFREPVAEFPAPPPVPPVTPVPASAPAPEAFQTERSAPALTWRSRHDPRSLSFGVRSRLAGSAPLQDHLWPTGPVLDQGTEGACIGCGTVDAVNTWTAPPFGIEDALSLYRLAQQLDDVPGEDYSGTSVLAGMQAAVERGWIGGYLWAFGTKDVAQAVLQRGPVVIGVPWLSGMYDTGPGGLVQLAGEDTGAGHCLAVVGIRMKGPQGQPGPFFVWQNSWGPSYGDGGLGYIHHRDLAALLHGAGEAAIPTRETLQ